MPSTDLYTREDVFRGGPGLDGYAFRADTYCEDCAATVLDFGPGPWVWLDFIDSEQVPQPIFFGEADGPVHCAACAEHLYGPAPLAVDTPKRQQEDDSMLATIVARARLPRDEHLRLVLAHNENDPHTPWVTWVQNVEAGGYFWGHYSADRDSAISDYLDRAQQYDIIGPAGDRENTANMLALMADAAMTGGSEPERHSHLPGIRDIGDLDPRQVIQWRYKGSPNFMTPQPERFGWLADFVAYELSSGGGLHRGERIWGVTVVELLEDGSTRTLDQVGGVKACDCFQTRQAAESHIENLRQGLGSIFGPLHVGCHVDGAFGQDHLRDRLADLVEETIDTPRPSADLLNLLEDLRAPGELADSYSIDQAVEHLQMHTAPGYVWILEAGDLVLSAEEEAQV